jgi:thioredoxin-related protein
MNMQTNNQNILKKNVTNKKNNSRKSLLLILAVFVTFVTIVIVNQDKDSIDWIKDYQTGLELAKKQNKPMLIAFHKQFTQYCTLMNQETYPDKRVIKYIRDNFIPIYIDVDKQPKTAQLFNVGYYPTHYIKYHDSEKLIGPHIGHDTPKVFIEKLERLLNEAGK